MGVWAYITGTLLAPNLAGYLINKKLLNREEKKLVKEIESIISEFNPEFDDKAVDSNFFVEYLEKESTIHKIFDRVFFASETAGIDYNELSNEYAENAFEFVNKGKASISNPQVKQLDIFEDYFLRLFELLKEIRVSLLEVKDKALTSIIADTAYGVRDDIKTSIASGVNERYLIEEKIELIDEKITRGFYEEGLELIEDVLESVDLSTTYREQFLARKARIFIKKGDVEKIKKLKRMLSRINRDNKEVLVLEYWIGFYENDSNRVITALNEMSKNCYDNTEIELKEIYFEINYGDIEKAYKQLTEDGVNLRSDFLNKAESYFYLALIFMRKGEHFNAIKPLSTALEYENNILYEYNLVFSKIISFFKKHHEHGGGE